MALGHILSQSISRNEGYRSPVTRPSAPPPAALSHNLNRLLSAAVVSPRFQRLLLADPVAALAAGYNGESFPLTQTEYAAVTSLCVNSLRDFAAQLLRLMQEAISLGPEFSPEFSPGIDAVAQPEQPAPLPYKQESAYSRFVAPTRPARYGFAGQ